MLSAKLTRRLPVAVPGAAEACTRVGALLAFAGLQLHYAPDGRASAPPSDVWIAFDSRWGPMRLAPLAAQGQPLAPVGAGGRADALGLASMLQSSEPLILALERAFDSILGLTRTRLTLNVVFSDGTTLTDHVLWF